MTEPVLDEVTGDLWVEFEEQGPANRDLAAVAKFLRVPDAGYDEPNAAPENGAVFVDPDGSWIREGSKEFFEALGDPNPDYDASLFAVKNLGFIAIGVSPQLFTSIKIHPTNVTEAALLSTQRLLSSIQCDCFRISYLEETWLSETTPSAARTISRLSEICAREELGITASGSASLVH